MEKKEKKTFKDLVIEESQKGNVVFMTIQGAMTAPVKDFVNQPTEGLLYDLNRDTVTVLTWLGTEKESSKWVNDYAVGMVIAELKKQIAELKKQ